MNSQISRFNSPRVKAFLVIAIIALGTILRLYNLGEQSLWNDEIKSVRYASTSIPKIVTITFWRDTHQPLYYLVLHLFMFLGSNEVIVRLASMISGILCIGLFYLILKNWFDEKYGLLGAFLLAISPFHIWYSQETRPYMLLLFFSLLSIFFLQKLIKNRTNRYRIGFILSAAATYYCHSIALTFLIFIGIFAYFFRSRVEWKYWTVTFAWVILIISPTFFPLLINPPSHSADAFRDVNLAQIGYIFWAFSTGYALGPSLVDLHYLSFKQVIQQFWPLIISVAGLIGFLIVNGYYRLWFKEKQIFKLLILWLFVPIIFVALAAIFSTHPINVRYVILGFPAFLIALTLGIGELRFKWISLLILLIFIFISSYSLYNYYKKPMYQRENNRAAGDYLSKHADKDDLIIVSAAYTIKNLRYYYPDASMIVKYPIEGKFVKKQVLEKELKEIISGRDKFWLFLSRTYDSDKKELILQFCDTNYERVKYVSWNGVVVILYNSDHKT